MNHVNTDCADTDFALKNQKSYQKGYIQWGTPIVQFIIPILVLIVLNFFLVQKVSSYFIRNPT